MFSPQNQPRDGATIAPPPAPLTFIVLTNFFPAAHRAIRYAAELAAPLGAQLVLLHVQSVNVLEGELLDQQDYQGDLMMAVRALADEVYVPTTVELLPDLQAATAAELARRFAPALFVLGRADDEVATTAVEAAVLEVLRGGAFPLLIVPESYHQPPRLTHALVAADGEPFELHKPGAALQLLAATAPRMTVAYVTPHAGPEAGLTALHETQASGLTAIASHVTPLAVQASQPGLGLLQALSQTQADILVLIARRRSFLGSMFHRSVTTRALRVCPVPTLVLPASDE